MLQHSCFRISRLLPPGIAVQMCSEKKHNDESFQKIHKEIPFVESFCYEVTGLNPVGSLKYDSDTGVFL